MAINEVVALDVGEVRIGVARASLQAKIPEPLQAIATVDAHQSLTKLIKANQADALVIGLPRDMHFHETAQTRWVRQWAKDLQKIIHLPMFWQDEAATTLQAESMLPKSVVRHNKGEVDSMAASIILDDFLKTPESQRMVI